MSLYEHLAELLQSIDLKDPNALAEFESKSLDIKAARFNPIVGVKTVAPEIEDLTTKVHTTLHAPSPLTTHRRRCTVPARRSGGTTQPWSSTSASSSSGASTTTRRLAEKVDRVAAT